MEMVIKYRKVAFVKTLLSRGNAEDMKYPKNNLKYF